VTQRFLARYRTLLLSESAPARPVDAAVKVGCAFCEWNMRGSLEQAHEAFGEHVCDRPRPTSTRRRTSGFSLRPTSGRL
jgi:hypothetical protein